jgi:hypothetical protein
MTVAGVEYRYYKERWFRQDGSFAGMSPAHSISAVVDSAREIALLTALAAAEDEAEAQCNQRIKLIEQNAKLIDCARHYASVQGAHNQMPLEVAKRFTKRAAERLKEIEG